MNPHQRQQLEEHLKSLPKGEQDRLYRLAAAMRRAEQKGRKGERAEFDDLDAPRPGSARRGADPVRLWVLKVLARELASSSPERQRGVQDVEPSAGSGETRRSRSGREGGALTGTAVEVGKRRCVVRDDDGSEVECRLPAHLAGKQQDALCVGDRVTFTTPDDERRERAMVEHVLPRRTVLTRRDPKTRQRQAVAANVDAVVIVVSVVSPPLHPRLIDRYLLAIGDSWVEAEGAHAADPDPAGAIIAVNKIDLLDGASPAERNAELNRLEPYRALGIPVVECCAADGRGMGELAGLLAGKTVVFVGHSGVGKSSLTNALDPRLGARIGEVGDAANRGRHTTTAARMYEVDPSEPRASARAVPGAGSDAAGSAGSPPLRGAEGEREGAFRVIDTPGIRFFGLDDLTPAELRDSMPEFRRLRQGCKFNDCTHTHEPGCAVKEAVARGEVHPARYETYLRLLEEIGQSRAPTLRIRPDEPLA